MIGICEHNIFVRYEDSEGTIGHWCNLEEFFEEVMNSEIVDDVDNGPTITINGETRINWLVLLLERQQGKSKFKYKIGEGEYLHF